MEYFKSGFKSVLGTPPPEKLPTGADTVERLVDRVHTSTLLEDRRDACRALKALSRTYRVEVGTRGMEALRQVLEMDRTDCEIIGLALDILCNVTNSEAFDEEVEKYGLDHKVGEQFTEIFIKQPESVEQVLRVLEEFDFRVRWPALKLLANLLANTPKDIQEIILSTRGVPKLMDLFSDSREIIRNEAFLLLIQLTKGNANIQKLVAFENAFDTIYDVIIQEGGIDGGIVVEDCLLLMLNLLRGNYSNQHFFYEGGYIQRLNPILQQPLEPDSSSLVTWSPQKVANVHCTVQVIRALVAASGPAQSVAACQNIMKRCGLLQSLCDILMINGVSAEVLTETINAVAEVVRGNKNNQEFLSSVMAPSSPPRPAIVVLLMTMVNEKQPFLLRCAVLYCFQCYLYKNEAMQEQLVQTLLPQDNEATLLTTGQLLCGGLFSVDSVSNWFSSVALSHALIDSSNQKEQLTRVLLARTIGRPPVTLMQQCVTLFRQSNKIQSKLGLLMLLCRWTSYSSLAVRTFIEIESSVTYLTELLKTRENNDDLQEILLQSMCAFLLGICVHFNDDKVENYTKDKLCSLIENVIGLERYQDAIGGISRHEVYFRTLKHPQLSATNASEILLDHEFCRLLNSLEAAVFKTVLEGSSAHKSTEQMSNSLSPPDSVLVAQYKEFIRQQDVQIAKLNQTVEALAKEKGDLWSQLQELQSTVNYLSDQNLVLQAAQENLINNIASNAPTSSDLVNTEHESQVGDCETRLSESLTISDDSKMKSSNLVKAPSELEGLLQQKIEEFERLKRDQDDLLELLAHQDRKMTIYREKLSTFGEKVDSDDSSVEADD